MKKYIAVFCVVLSLLISCTDEVENTTVTLNFTHNWDGVPVTNKDFNKFKFTNANGEEISINRLRYVISNVSLINNSNHFLIDLGENTGMSIPVSNIETGTFDLKFTFGFKDSENKDGIYQDLNSANFNVPGMLGGGYHFMQFDGKYIDTDNEEANFNYHAIRAVNRENPDELVFQDTSFEVNLGKVNINNNQIEIQMNIAEWFKNPNLWNLNELNTVLMPNFEAQKLMSANGKSVFSLRE